MTHQPALMYEWQWFVRDELVATVRQTRWNRRSWRPKIHLRTHFALVPSITRELGEIQLHYRKIGKFHPLGMLVRNLPEIYARFLGGTKKMVKTVTMMRICGQGLQQKRSSNLDTLSVHSHLVRKSSSFSQILPLPMQELGYWCFISGTAFPLLMLDFDELNDF